MLILENLITEARVDKERMIQWGGQELFDKFEKVKNSLEGRLRDMTYWTSKKNPHDPKELEKLVDDILAEREAKKEKERLASEGAELIYEDADWLVYKINTFEASQKYGKNTKWCIAGSKRWERGRPSPDSHWNSYKDWGWEFYFYILKHPTNELDAKWAVSVKRDEDGKVVSCEIFNAGDVSVEGIPNAPKIDTLPEWISIDEANYIWDRDMDSAEGELDDDDFDDEDADDFEEVPLPDEDGEEVPPPAPPAYTPVEVDITSEDISYEFEARSAEEGLAAIGAEILSNALAANNAYVVRTADGHITVALYQPQNSRGSIILAPSNGRYYLLSFVDVDSAVDFLRANMGSVRSSDEVDANGNAIAREELKSSCSLHEAFAYLKHLEDYRVDVEVKPLSPNDKEYVRDAIKNRSEHFDWYVLHYDTETTDYLNEIEFSNLEDAWEKFKGEKPMSKSDRVELIFAPEFTDNEFENNVVVTYKNN